MRSNMTLMFTCFTSYERAYVYLRLMSYELVFEGDLSIY